jgi:hypothetical protein
MYVLISGASVLGYSGGKCMDTGLILTAFSFNITWIVKWMQQVKKSLYIVII